MLEWWSTFFCRMVNTPVGVSWPFLPVLTLVRPMRRPLRYTYAICSLMLTSTIIGPPVDICGNQANSPGCSGSSPSTVGAGREAFTGLVTTAGDVTVAAAGLAADEAGAGMAGTAGFGVVAKAGARTTAQSRAAQARACVEWRLDAFTMFPLNPCADERERGQAQASVRRRGS